MHIQEQQRPLLHEAEDAQVGAMQREGGASDLAQFLYAQKVVKVGVGRQNAADGPAARLGHTGDGRSIIRRVNDNRLAGGLIRDKVAIGLECTQGENFNDHG
jgi:hypothetical protein